jgi:hypothetical protein
MTGSSEHKYAVLTGDVVGSSKLAAEDLTRVMQGLRDGAKRFQQVFPKSVYGTLDVFRGDGWQLLMTDCKRSLRGALFLRAAVKSNQQLGLDTRIAIAWGAVDQDSLKPARISQSTGEAFTRSGRALLNMPKNSRLAVDFFYDLPEPAQKLINASTGFLDELICRATPKQMQALSLALLGMTQEQIARETGKGQSTIQQALQGAGWQRIHEFLQKFEYLF